MLWWACLCSAHGEAVDGSLSACLRETAALCLCTCHPHGWSTLCAPWKEPGELIMQTSGDLIKQRGLKLWSDNKPAAMLQMLRTLMHFANIFYQVICMGFPLKVWSRNVCLYSWLSHERLAVGGTVYVCLHVKTGAKTQWTHCAVIMKMKNKLMPNYILTLGLSVQVSLHQSMTDNWYRVKFPLIESGHSRL